MSVTTTIQVSFSWEEYENTERALAKKIAESDWKFDQIVGIARGGMFICDCLSRIFEKPIALIVASSYKNKTQEELALSEEVAMVTSKIGKRILLVDDLVDSGVSLEKTKQFLKKKFPEIEEVRTAVLYKKSCTRFAPDYHALDIEDGVWIDQPFEKFDQEKLT